MGLIVVWLILMVFIITGAADNSFMHFVIGAFLFFVVAGHIYVWTIVMQSDRYKKEKAEADEKKARLKREKQIQKEEAQRQKRQAKENQRQRRKDEKKSRKRRRKEKRLDKKFQKQALKQAKRDFFIQRRLIKKQDKLQKRLQKKLDRHNRKEVMLTQPVRIICSDIAVTPKVKRDRPKPKMVKLTSFILPIIIFIIMMGCIISTQVIPTCDSYSHTQVITDYHSITYDDSS